MTKDDEHQGKPRHSNRRREDDQSVGDEPKKLRKSHERKKKSPRTLQEAGDKRKKSKSEINGVMLVENETKKKSVEEFRNIEAEDDEPTYSTTKIVSEGFFEEDVAENIEEATNPSSNEQTTVDAKEEGILNEWKEKWENSRAAACCSCPFGAYAILPMFLVILTMILSWVLAYNCQIFEVLGVGFGAFTVEGEDSECVAWDDYADDDDLDATFKIARATTMIMSTLSLIAMIATLVMSCVEFPPIGIKIIAYFSFGFSILAPMVLILGFSDICLDDFYSDDDGNTDGNITVCEVGGGGIFAFIVAAFWIGTGVSVLFLKPRDSGDTASAQEQPYLPRFNCASKCLIGWSICSFVGFVIVLIIMGTATWDVSAVVSDDDFNDDFTSPTSPPQSVRFCYWRSSDGDYFCPVPGGADTDDCFYSSSYGRYICYI